VCGWPVRLFVFADALRNGRSSRQQSSSLKDSGGVGRWTTEPISDPRLLRTVLYRYSQTLAAQFEAAKVGQVHPCATSRDRGCAHGAARLIALPNALHQQPRRPETVEVESLIKRTVLLYSLPMSFHRTTLFTANAGVHNSNDAHCCVPDDALILRLHHQRASLQVINKFACEPCTTGDWPPRPRTIDTLSSQRTIDANSSRDSTMPFASSTTLNLCTKNSVPVPDRDRNQDRRPRHSAQPPNSIQN
jgi:hypothetical protein